MATVEKIRKDIEKTKEKISAQQKRLRELEAQLTEEENLEIVRMVKAVRMDNKELTAFLKAYASGLITLPDGMMEAEAAPDPDDADMEGMAKRCPRPGVSGAIRCGSRCAAAHRPPPSRTARQTLSRCWTLTPPSRWPRRRLNLPRRNPLTPARPAT